MPYDSEDAYSSDGGSSDKSGFRGSKTSKALTEGGKSMSSKGGDMIEAGRQQAASNMNRQEALNLPSYRKGGKVRKTGPALLHKGERVIPRGKVADHHRAARRGHKKVRPRGRA